MKKLPKKKSVKTLLVLKEFYRLWFEFYRMCKNGTCKEFVIAKNIQDAKTIEFYESWGDVVNIKFDDWWETHEHLFREPTVKPLSSEIERQTENSLLIEIPLNQSITQIMKSIKGILESDSRFRVKGNKSKRVFTSKYQLSQSEPRKELLQNLLIIYRDLYLPETGGRFKKQRGHGFTTKKLLQKIEENYKTRKRKFPDALVGSKSNQDVVIRNLSRWMNWANNIMINVSKGVFPGNYNKH